MTTTVRASAPPAASPRMLTAVVLGTVLNPLNSSMIAVAVLRIQDAFGVGVLSGAWLISSFYLVAAVGQSVLGRLADQFGPRRLMCVGFVLVGAAGVLGPLAPSFGWVIAARVLLAAGTSAGFPAGLALLRHAAGGQAPPPATLAVISIANSSTAALGPVVGGLLIALAGWPMVFVVNVLVAGAGLVAALRWLPRDAQHPGGVGLRLVRRLVDVPGMLAFSTMLGTLLALLLSLRHDPLWWLAPVSLGAGALLVALARRREDPFIDVDGLVRNRPLLGVCTQYLLVNVVFFGVFFALPLWLEGARGYQPAAAGLLMAPLPAVGVLAAVLAARVVARAGVRVALLCGAVPMLVGTLLLLTFGAGTPVAVVLVVAGVLGLPIGFNNLALQSALYDASDPHRTGAAAGLFQTCRFVGAVLATSGLGIAFADGVSSAGLHQVALGFVGMSVLVLLGSTRRR